MLGRVVKGLFFVLSLAVAIGISVLWFRSYAGRDYESDEMYRLECNFNEATGGSGRYIVVESTNGTLYIIRSTGSLPSRTQYATFCRLPTDQAQVEEYVAWCRRDSRRSVWYSKVPLFDSDTTNLVIWTDDFAAVHFNTNWEYGGFDFSQWSGPSGFFPVGHFQQTDIVVPDWFILAVALIAPLMMTVRSPFYRSVRRVLAGRCRECGCDRAEVAGPCAQCQTIPTWAGMQLARLGEWRWLLWWVPALVLGICARIALHTKDFFNYGFGWPDVLAILAVGYMLAVLIARAFVARQPPPEPPRGFAVVINPPHGENKQT